MSVDTPKPNFFAKAAAIAAFSELGIRQFGAHPAWTLSWDAATAEYNKAKQIGVQHPELNERCIEAAKDAIRKAQAASASK